MHCAWCGENPESDFLLKLPGSDCEDIGICRRCDWERRNAERSEKRKSVQCQRGCGNSVLLGEKGLHTIWCSACERERQRLVRKG